MFGLSKMFSHTSTDLSIYVDAVQKVVTAFVSTELRIYLADEKHPDFNRSVIANIALFDIEGLNSENGYVQMCRLLGSHHDQMVERRIKQLLHGLYIKYGQETISQLAERVIQTMHLAYPVVHKENIRSLHERFNTFWLIPFIKKAYDEITLISN